jgi:hypothetical protein
MEFDFRVTLPFILTLATLFYTWWRTRDRNVEDKFKAVDERFKLGSERMDRHDTRLNSIEQTLRDLPVKADMHALQLSMSEMRGEMKVMATAMSGSNSLMERLEAVVSRHEEHLLKKS